MLFQRIFSKISSLSKNYPFTKINLKFSKPETIPKNTANIYTYPGGTLHNEVFENYKKLPTPENMIQATYVWIDGMSTLRLKDRILKTKPTKPEELPLWAYDGGSTYQATLEKSDVLLVPKTIYKDPFKPGKNDILVLCESYEEEDVPHESNTRKKCSSICEKFQDHDVWFGFEQEYTVLGPDGRPFGWPKGGFPLPQGPYYCGVGGANMYVRQLMEAHMIACVYAGVDMYGTNAEVMLSQLEYQTGPSSCIKAADDLWVSRYILERLAENCGLHVTFDPKPITGAWNGSGCHTNFSSKGMREDGGIEEIKKVIEKLSKKHKEHIAAYDPKGGLDNMRRLTGEHETSNIDEFSAGVGHRGASLRIPGPVETQGKGYLEDRRPSSNCDPYSVVSAIMCTAFDDNDSK